MKNGIVYGLALVGILSTRVFGVSINLGSAGNFAALNLSQDDFDVKGGSIIYGNLGVAAKADLEIVENGRVFGTIFGGQNASVALKDGSTASGGTVLPSSAIAQAVLDAIGAADYYAGLTALQTLDDLEASTIQGNGGLNVFKVKDDVKLSGKDEKLIISGGAADLFVFNVYGKVDLDDGAAIVLQGVRPDQVLFNVIGDGDKVNSANGSTTAGIFLAKEGEIDVAGGSHQSQFIAGDLLKLDEIEDNVSAQGVQSVPDTSSYYFATFGLAWALMLALSRRQHSRACE